MVVVAPAPGRRSRERAGRTRENRWAPARPGQAGLMRTPPAPQQRRPRELRACDQLSPKRLLEDRPRRLPQSWFPEAKGDVYRLFFLQLAGDAWLKRGKPAFCDNALPE